MSTVALRDLHAAWLARLPKGTRVRATFELTHDDVREQLEIVCASQCMISIGPEGSRRGFIRPDLVSALDALVSGAEGSYGGWKLDAASVIVDQAPKSATRAQIKALLTPLLSEVF